MAKDKNKGSKDSKKGKPGDDLLDTAAKSLKKFRRVTRQLTKLSTGQKLVGGVALLAAGLTYLAKKQADADAPTHLGVGASAAPLPAYAADNAQVAEPALAGAELAGNAAAGLKPRKPKKSK